jgi:iron complex outermembrane receptor protein
MDMKGDFSALGFRSLRLGASMLAMAGGLCWAGIAQAQVQAELPEQSAPSDTAPAPEALEGSDIVVTGTLLRGVAPVGTNSVSLNRADILATGAASANDLLASIPQVGNFGTVPMGTGSYALPIVRPNIRNLGASGGSTTLVLMNGHRLVGAGVLQTSVDPSVIPPDLIERVEIIPDGGSSIYGSDAIGGVINFITRKRYDGIGVNARYGFADNYQAFDGSVVAGKDWGSASAFLSYAYAWHDNILGIDRDYVTADNRANGGADHRGTACAPGNLIIGGIPYALPGKVPGTLNRCDQTDYADIVPRETRHSVFGGFTQDLSDGVTFGVTGYWSQRDTITRSAQSSQSETITVLNPYFTPVGAELAQTVAIAFDPVFGPSNVSPARFTSWGLTPTLEAELGGGWQLRALGNYGRSTNETTEDSINSSAVTAAFGGTTTATAINPYNLSATNAALLAKINDFVNYGQADQKIAEGRLVVDGPLFAIPGGDVRLAAGAEYHYENIDSFTGSGPAAAITGGSAFTKRNVKSLFGEVLVPIFGEGNRTGGMYALELSGSLRYDDYSDVGGTTNPKIGITWRPVQSLTLRGNYGTSFHAPSLADLGNSTDSRVQVIPFSPFRAANSSPFDILRPTIAIAGGNANLKPETADTWSLGFDFTPEAIQGLVASATYYNVKFRMRSRCRRSRRRCSSPIPIIRASTSSTPRSRRCRRRSGSHRINGAPSLASLYTALALCAVPRHRADQSGRGAGRRDRLQPRLSAPDGLRFDQRQLCGHLYAQPQVPDDQGRRIQRQSEERRGPAGVRSPAWARGSAT